MMKSMYDTYGKQLINSNVKTISAQRSFVRNVFK